jgi:hypothetical protein
LDLGNFEKALQLPVHVGGLHPYDRRDTVGREWGLGVRQSGKGADPVFRPEEGGQSGIYSKRHGTILVIMTNRDSDRRTIGANPK